MRYDDVPWDDHAALKELAGSRDLDPHPKFCPSDRFELVRIVNERLLSVDPTEYVAAMRISRVHKFWSERNRDPALAAHHTHLRRVWLWEALCRQPSDAHRAAILNALGEWRPSADAQHVADDAVRVIAVCTVPHELVRLARSLREGDPALPHLAVIAAHRAVAYADISAAGDPRAAGERSMARHSLAACLRRTDRSRDAVELARATIAVQSDGPVGWTILTGATRDLHGGASAVEVVDEAVDRMGVEVAAADPYFASAAAAAYRAAGMPGHADAWQLAAEPLNGHSQPSRQEALERAGQFAAVLRQRRQHGEAGLIEHLVAQARRAIAPAPG
ncbi:hypothetical protein [Capillimicrobium parvum]|uniref:hypothetical protein n=1 Tax=Capillimicrobium parvum TaxID=2884022 RepID=UPI00216B30A7|nr:hypothetical protein [Capillimicrobium parvum]